MLFINWMYGLFNSTDTKPIVGIDDNIENACLKNIKQKEHLSQNHDIMILSEAEATLFTPHSKDTILIRITEPKREFPPLKYNYRHVHNAYFFDMETSSEFTEVESSSCYKEISKEAIAIANFIKRYKNSYVVIHCHAGISRSAAVAILAARIKGNQEAERYILNEDTYWEPNYWVLKAILSAIKDS